MRPNKWLFVYGFLFLELIDMTLYLLLIWYPNCQLVLDLEAYLIFVYYNQFSFNLVVFYSTDPSLRRLASYVTVLSIGLTCVSDYFVVDYPYNVVYMIEDFLFLSANLFIIRRDKMIGMFNLTDLLKSFLLNSLLINTILSFNNSNSIQYILVAAVPLQSVETRDILESNLHKEDLRVLRLYWIIGLVGAISMFFRGNATAAVCVVGMIFTIIVLVIAHLSRARQLIVNAKELNTSLLHPIAAVTVNEHNATLSV